MDRGYGTVDRAIASDTRGPGFKSSHVQLFKKNWPFQAFFLYFLLLNTIGNKQMFDKSLPMTGFEPRISVLEATALPTEPQPLPMCNFYFLLTVYRKDENEEKRDCNSPLKNKAL